MNAAALQFFALVILLAPLTAAVVAAALGPRILRGQTHWAALLGVGAAFVCSFLTFLEVRSAPSPVVSAAIPIYSWFTTGGGVPFQVEFLIDPLTSVMLLVVTGIALLVLVYSRDYMRHDGHAARGYERFFACVSLFVFSMCALVLGGNFLLLYLGWEAVGLCSYLLIGFYYDRPAAAAAAKKAFLVNRVGDFGFGLAILLIYLTFGTLEYQPVFDMIQRGVTATGGALPQWQVTAIALLLFCGACGKSAQLPLHVWLPDAMEGPSPVSALIHAATMVTAGVFMVARCGAVFAASPTAMSVVAGVGALTALFAATIALVQTDVKRVLAYSTISQLGYMFLGLGVYAGDAAIFHLGTHAFFKALLFLAAGSIMHALNGVIDVRQFSGLRSMLPWTHRTFFVGALALAGFPLLSGFFSKDEILHHAFASSKGLGLVGLITAALTAFYTFRIVFLAFHGRERLPEGVHPHESGKWMLVPLFVLALGAVGAGWIGAEGTGGLHGFLAPVFAKTLPESAAKAGVESVTFWEHYGLMIASGAISLACMLIAYVLYVQQPWIPALTKATFGEAYRVLWNKYYFDELYEDLLVRPARGVARFLVGLDDYLIDGLLWLVTAVPRGAALALRTFQSGFVQGYALSMALGIAAMLLAVLWM